MPVNRLEQGILEKIQNTYEAGITREYRSDMSAKGGKLNVILGDGEAMQIAKGEVEFVLLGFRVYVGKEGQFRNYSKRDWLELFFLNEMGNVCSFSVHGHSVTEFFRLRRQFVLEGRKNALPPMRLKIKFAEAKGKDDKGKDTTIYIAKFSFTVLEGDEATLWHEIHENIGDIFEVNTVSISSVNKMAFGYMVQTLRTLNVIASNSYTFVDENLMQLAHNTANAIEAPTEDEALPV